MAIGVRLDFPAATTDQYDRACSLMGLTPRGAGPAGALFHWARVDGPGMVITDVWNSRDQFEEFARDQIGPFCRQAGIIEQPTTTFSDVYNYLTAGALSSTITPIAVVMEFPGEMRQYDEVLDLMGFTPQGRGADGGLFHWATRTADGARTTEVWQDRATFDAFAETNLIPYTAKAGVAPASSVTVYDVYNYFTAGA
ncbi:hypothetical protein [Catenulispora subtropica]|uniref:ABM domain-containing protein n=1 Tax=Catenulispora subtropica TaxID=450798 RepID=A0ABP5DXA8_9ACTN